METINIDTGQVVNKKLVLVHQQLHNDEIFMGSFKDDCIIVEVTDSIDISDIYQVIDDEVSPIDRLSFVYHYDGPNRLRFFEQDDYVEETTEMSIIDVSGLFSFSNQIDMSNIDVTLEFQGLGNLTIDSSNIDASGIITGSGIMNIDASANVDVSENSFEVTFIINPNKEVTIHKRIEPKYNFISDKVVSLIETLNNKIKEQLIVDILTCNLNDTEIVEEIAVIQSDLNINIQYSVDQTGNNPQGNWVLESDNVNVKDVYFTEGIDEWSGVLLSFDTSDYNQVELNYNNINNLKISYNKTTNYRFIDHAIDIGANLYPNNNLYNLHRPSDAAGNTVTNNALNNGLYQINYVNSNMNWLEITISNVKIGIMPNLDIYRNINYDNYKLVQRYIITNNPVSVPNVVKKDIATIYEAPYTGHGVNGHRNVTSTAYIFINYNQDSYSTNWRVIHRDDSSRSRIAYQSEDVFTYYLNTYDASGRRILGTDGNHPKTSFVNYYNSYKSVGFKFDFSSASNDIGSSEYGYGSAKYDCAHRYGSDNRRYGKYYVHVYNVMFNYTFTNRYIYINEGSSTTITYNSSNIEFTNLTNASGTYGVGRLHTKLRYNDVVVYTMRTDYTATNRYYNNFTNTLGNDPLLTKVHLDTQSSYIKHTFTIEKDLKGIVSNTTITTTTNPGRNASSGASYSSKNNLCITLTHNYTPPSAVTVLFSEKPFYNINYVIRPVLSSATVSITGHSYNIKNGKHHIEVPYTDISCTDITNNYVSVENFSVKYGDISFNNDTSGEKFYLDIDPDTNLGTSIEITVYHTNHGKPKYPNGGGTEIINKSGIRTINIDSYINNQLITYNQSNKTYTLTRDVSFSDLGILSGNIKLFSREIFDGNGKHINFNGANTDGLFEIEPGITGTGNETVTNPSNIPVIKNLTIKNANINQYQGAFIPRNTNSSVIIDNCVSDNSFNNTTCSSFVGQYFGKNGTNNITANSYYLRITNCINNTPIDKQYSSGFLPIDSPDTNKNGIIYCEGCINYGVLTGEHVGAIAGAGCRIKSDTSSTGKIEIKNCINYGINNGNYHNNVSYIVGNYSQGVTISNCANYGGTGILNSGIRPSGTGWKNDNISNNYHTGLTPTTISGIMTYNSRISTHPTLDYFNYTSSTTPISLNEDTTQNVTIDKNGINLSNTSLNSLLNSNKIDNTYKIDISSTSKLTNKNGTLVNNNINNDTYYINYTNTNTRYINFDISGITNKNTENKTVPSLIIGVRDSNVPDSIDVYHLLKTYNITINPQPDNIVFDTDYITLGESVIDNVDEDYSNGRQQILDISRIHLSGVDLDDDNFSLTNNVEFKIHISTDGYDYNLSSGQINSSGNTDNRTGISNTYMTITWQLTPTNFKIYAQSKPDKNDKNISNDVYKRIQVYVRAKDTSNTYNANQILTRIIRIDSLPDAAYWDNSLNNVYFNDASNNNTIRENITGQTESYRITLTEDNVNWSDKNDSDMCMNSLYFNIRFNNEQTNNMIINFNPSNSNSNSGTISNDLLRISCSLSQHNLIIELTPIENRNTYNTSGLNTIDFGIKNNPSGQEYSYVSKTIIVTPVNSNPILNTESDIDGVSNVQLQDYINYRLSALVPGSSIILDLNAFVQDIENDNYTTDINHSLDISAQLVNASSDNGKLTINKVALNDDTDTKDPNRFKLEITAANGNGNEDVDVNFYVYDNGDGSANDDVNGWDTTNNVSEPRTITISIKGQKFNLEVKTDNALHTYYDNYFGNYMIFNEESNNKYLTLIKNIHYKDLLQNLDASLSEPELNEDLAILLDSNTTFDGQGKVIDLQGMQVSGIFKSYGTDIAFQKTNITIKNLNVVNADISDNKSILIAPGSTNITLENCTINGDIIDNSGGAFFGSGCSNCSLVNCYSMFNSVNSNFHPIGLGTLTGNKYYSIIKSGDNNTYKKDTVTNSGYIYNEENDTIDFV